MPKSPNFKTSELTELIKFHKDVESILENLTDESQVCSENLYILGLAYHSLLSVLPFTMVRNFVIAEVLLRFEGFPTKKLEAMRMAAALYNKLHSILTELQDWKVAAP